MKRNLLVVLLAVCAVVCAAPAYSQIWVDESEGYGGTGSAGDSTTFAIPNRNFAAIAADSTVNRDTLAWIDVSQHRLHLPATAAIAVVKISLNTDAATGDSIGYVIQYSADKSIIHSKAKAYLTGAGPHVIPVMYYDTHANDPSLGFPYVRVILGDEDTSRTSGYASVSFYWLFLESSR
jgi:hypothetical protein